MRRDYPDMWQGSIGQVFYLALRGFRRIQRLEIVKGVSGSPPSIRVSSARHIAVPSCVLSAFATAYFYPDETVRIMAILPCRGNLANAENPECR